MTMMVTTMIKEYVADHFKACQRIVAQSSPVEHLVLARQVPFAIKIVSFLMTFILTSSFCGWDAVKVLMKKIVAHLIRIR